MQCEPRTILFVAQELRPISLFETGKIPRVERGRVRVGPGDLQRRPVHARHHGVAEGPALGALVEGLHHDGLATCRKSARGWVTGAPMGAT